jgi:hypothetical protein
MDEPQFANCNTEQADPTFVIRLNESVLPKLKKSNIVRLEPALVNDLNDKADPKVTSSNMLNAFDNFKHPKIESSAPNFVAYLILIAEPSCTKFSTDDTSPTLMNPRILKLLPAAVYISIKLQQLPA